MAHTKGDGVFKIRGNKIYVHGTINGKFYRKSTGKKVTPATKAWIKKADPLKVLAELIGEQVLKVGTDLKSFGYEVLELTASNRGEQYQKDVIRAFEKRILPVFEHFKIEDIKPIDIVKFLESLKKELSNDRVKHIKNVFGLILDYAVDNEIIDKNPVRSKTVSQVDLTYIPENTQAYTPEEVNLLLEGAKGWLKVFLDLSFKTGLRTGEAMGLKWEDIDLEKGILYIRRSISKGVVTEQTEKSKSNKQHFRRIPLFESSLELLRKYYEVRPSDEWLFINKDGRFYRESKTIVDYHFKPLCEKVGVEYKTLYATRRTYATLMKYAGEDFGKVQETMGHSKGSKITDKHYIDPRIIEAEHLKKEAERREALFKIMTQKED